MNAKRFLIFVVFIGLSAQLYGQINARQKSQDRDQLEQGKEGMARDQEELQAFQQAVTEFQGAQQSGDTEKLQETYQGLLASMKRELEQGQAKAEQYKKEMQQSSRELRGERRDVRGSREDVDENVDYAEEAQARNAAQRGDDRRDRKDDKSDLESLAEGLSQQGAILQQLASPEALTAPDPETALANVNELVGQFQQLMVADLEASKGEMEEDAKELQEDRRESRSDRRQRYRRNEE
jgi:hypothetical protein